jgi:UDP-glucuronate decarboxylase
LISDGHVVIAVDNFYTGSRNNIAHLQQNPRFSVVEHDVTDPLDIDGEVEQIFNLACPASPPHYQRDPIKTTMTSVLGVYNMLELARKTGAKFLQASTSEVYGDPTIHPQPESYWGNVNPIGIRSCYDEGKRVAETLLFDFHRQYAVPIKVPRIFNTYGPRMDPEDGRVVSNFIVQALRGQDLTIYGDGTQTRSFCFVDDLVEGFVRFMATSADVTGPINLGNTGEFTVSELAEKVLAKVGRSSRIVYRELPSDDPKVRQPDITKARDLLGWQPKIALDEGLDRTIAYFTKVVTP